MKKVFLLMLVMACVAASPVLAAGKVDLNVFPKSLNGLERLVIQLPVKSAADAANFKLELIPGRVAETDGINQVRINAYIEPQSLQGYGYTYFMVSGNGEILSTLAAARNPKSRKEFVQGSPYLMGYNSNLPVVVYAPPGCEVRYRLWTATNKMGSAAPR